MKGQAELTNIIVAVNWIRKDSLERYQDLSYILERVI
jgi:hypothetical protein